MNGCFPPGSDGKETACSARDRGSTLGLGRFPCRREWQTTPIFWPGEFYEHRSLEPGAWQATVHGCNESDTTEQLTHTHISSVCKSIPISQFFPPLLPHLGVRLLVLYICVSIFCFANKIIHVWCLIGNKKWIQMLVLFLWARGVILRDIRELLGNDPGERKHFEKVKG